MIPRPLAALRHGAVAGEVSHFDYLHLGGAEFDESFATNLGRVRGPVGASRGD